MTRVPGPVLVKPAATPLMLTLAVLAKVKLPAAAETFNAAVAVEPVKAMLVELAPGFRQGQAPAGAIEQAHTQFFFQSANTPAEFRRLQAEAARGRRVAPVLDHPCEEPKIIEVTDCVHGQSSTPPDRSIHSNDAF